MLSKRDLRKNESCIPEKVGFVMSLSDIDSPITPHQYLTLSAKITAKLRV